MKLCSPSVFALLCATHMAASCHGAVIYVNKAAPGSTQSGTSWRYAFATVQNGLLSANPGDEIWVAKGTYLTTNVTLTLPSGIALYGGFQGIETARDQRDAANNRTILDGGPVNGPQKRVLAIADNATSSTVVDGFTIQNGSDYDFSNQRPGEGGGVYIGGGSPTISNNVITNNYTGGNRNLGAYGGGICIAGGTPLIQGNTITNNFAEYGGGIYAPSGIIRDNLIANNKAGPGYAGTGAGGGIDLGPSAVAAHNMIVGNNEDGSYGGGGGIACYGGTATDNLFMDNTGSNGRAMHCYGYCTVLRNTFTYDIMSPGTEVDFDGGVFSNNVMTNGYGNDLLLGYGPGNADGSQPLIVNNTFFGKVESDSRAILSEYYNGERPVLSNNIFYGWGTPTHQVNRSGDVPPVFTVDHNDIYGNTDNSINLPGASPIGQNGNISADPLFVNASNGDFHLQAASPCINAGNDAVVAAGDTDLDGKPRILGSHVDIGAYEVASITPAAFQDAVRAVKMAAGLAVASSADVSQLNVEASGGSAGKVDLRDAVHLLRSAVGFGG